MLGNERYSLEDFLRGNMPVLYHIKYVQTHGVILQVEKRFELMGNTRLRARFPIKEFLQPIPKLDQDSFEAFEFVAKQKGIQRGRASEFTSYLFIVLGHALFANQTLYAGKPRAQHILLSAGASEGMSTCFIGGYISNQFREWSQGSVPQTVSIAEGAMHRTGGKSQTDCNVEIGPQCRGIRLCTNMGDTILGLQCERENQLDPGNMNNRRDQMMILAGLAVVYDEFRKSVR